MMFDYTTNLHETGVTFVNIPKVHSFLQCELWKAFFCALLPGWFGDKLKNKGGTLSQLIIWRTWSLVTICYLQGCKKKHILVKCVQQLMMRILLIKLPATSWFFTIQLNHSSRAMKSGFGISPLLWRFSTKQYLWENAPYFISLQYSHKIFKTIWYLPCTMNWSFHHFDGTLNRLGV